MKHSLNRNDINRINLMVPVVIMIVIFTTFLQAGNMVDKNTIKIASQPGIEQAILGEILYNLIEEKTDLKVKLTKDVNNPMIQKGLSKGQYDLYPEYTGFAWSDILKRESLKDDAKLFSELQKIYYSNLNLNWVGIYGFNSTYGIAVREETAKLYNLKTYSDLAKISRELTFGAEPEFYEKEYGFSSLSAIYNMEFQHTKDLNLDNKYTALDDKSVDVISIFNTDSERANHSIVVLEDDRHYYDTYYCGSVVRTETLKNHPDLLETLMLLDNLISDSEMAKMNNLVSSGSKTESEVAKDFLKEKGL